MNKKKEKVNTNNSERKGVFMKKNVTKLLLVFFLILIYMYTLAIENIPNNLVIFEGENITLKTLLGMQVKLDDETMETVSNTNTNAVSPKVGKATLQVSLFDNITLKDVNVDVLPKSKVIPVGSIAGVKLYTSGVLVVGMSEIEGVDKKKHKPYENTGIKEGDTITQINDTPISSTEQLMENVNQAQGKAIKVKYIQEEQAKECSMEAIKTSNNEYKLGLWVRDSAAGVGTVTFYEPSTKTFGALGHGITDIDTEELINIASGEFITTRVLNITKGESGNPRKNPRNRRKSKKHWKNKQK